MSDDQEEQIQSSIEFDATPHVWLSHTGMKPGDSGTTELVQILSMGEDGVWARFLQRPEMSRWKVYVPRDRILSMITQDHAWPAQDVWEPEA